VSTSPLPPPPLPPAAVPRRPRPVQVIAPNESVGVWLRDLWSFRQALAALCSRAIRSRYKQAALGVGWAILQPLVQVGLYTLVFRGVAGVETAVPYPVFALAALLPFNLFQQLVSFGAPAFVLAQGIVTKVYFPRLYTVIAAGASAFANAAVTVVLLAGALLLLGVPVAPLGLLLALPLLAGTVLLGLGVACLLAAVNARFRDVQHALPLLMSVLLYVSPVLYPLQDVPAVIRPIAALNPVTGLVDGFRAAVLGLAPASWPLVWGSLAAATLFFVVGVWVFERTQARLIDVL
jgi:lipopolysaccharide transport system permease protein